MNKTNRDWDGNMTTTSKAALYYSVLRVIFFRKMIASFYSAKKDSLKGIEFPNEEAVEQNSFIAGTPDGIYWPLCGGGIHEELKDWSCFEVRRQPTSGPSYHCPSQFRFLSMDPRAKRVGSCFTF